MPVVISMLNAFTGLSAAATGIALNNTALIVAGMIVGASGSILTNLMAVANEPLDPGDHRRRLRRRRRRGGRRGGRRARRLGQIDERRRCGDPARVRQPRRDRSGYGMAVAQAQHAVRELTKELEKRGVEVSYAIHRSRADARPHERAARRGRRALRPAQGDDEPTPEFQRTDVSLVIGANDVTNPAAKNTPSSPIYGMPILEVADSRSVIVIKRSMNPGFAGIENELYYDPKTAMLFGRRERPP